MVIFNSLLYVYQGVFSISWVILPQASFQRGFLVPRWKIKFGIEACFATILVWINTY